MSLFIVVLKIQVVVLTLLNYRSERILAGPSFSGKVVSFCRQKGHGFVQPSDGTEPLFMHISELVININMQLFMFIDQLLAKNSLGLD